MKPVRPFTAPALALLAAALYGGPVLGAETDVRACNQLAREIALRAGEAELGLDAGNRSRLTEIAEAACLDFSLPPPSSVAAGGEDGAVARNGAEGEEGYRPFSGIEFVDPQDRVRRPGLKRR